MKTIYIVFYNNAMTFAFTSHSAAEEYVRIACNNNPGGYSRNVLRIAAVDLWLNYPHIDGVVSYDNLAIKG